MAEHRIPIAGMTCAACESTVVKAVRTLPGVTAARADRRAGVVTLTCAAAPTDAAVDGALAETPYSVGARPWLARDRAVWRDVAIAVAAVGAVAAVLIVTGAGDAAGRLTSLATTGSLLFIALLGVAASVSTCMALVGGLVMSLAASAPSTGPAIRRLRPHLAFNAGRIVGFAALGALVGIAGSALALSGTVLAVAMLAVAVVMGLLGVRLTGASPRLAAWQVSLPASWGAWARQPDGAPGTASDGRAALLGAASFFLPCGFTQAVQVLALSSGSAAQGAAIMAAFAIGTTPGLLAAGAAASAARRAGTARALRIVGVVVVAFALVTASGAVRTLAPGLGAATVAATERTSNVTDDGGTQVATTVVQAAGYSPADTVVYAGEPVRWVLDPEAVSCAGLIDADALGVGRVDALYEPVTVEFTLDEPGTYAFGCTMGMYDGTVTAIARPADS